MTETRRLRGEVSDGAGIRRLIATAAAACGGSTDTDAPAAARAAAAPRGHGRRHWRHGGASGATGGSAGLPVCSYGTPSQQCFTLDQLESMLNSPYPWGGDMDAGTDA
jgi:hypothetical protein